MEPSNTALKISMKMLDAKEKAASLVPKSSPLEDPKKVLRIKRVVNNLPYSCIVELFPIKDMDIDFVYYAALDSTDKRLFYKSEYPTRVLPSFTIYDLETEEKEFRFVCWPVKDNVIGNPTYFGPIPIHDPFYLGTYDLDIEFEKPSDKKLFKQVEPILEKHFGKAALPGKIYVKEDRYDVFLPSSNTMKLSANRNNFIHELVHASRKQVMFANKKFRFDEDTEMIEEFFAEGISNMVKDELNLQKNDYLKKGAVYGSTIGYNYDYRITDPSLITQNLQSSWGGILTLENARYYLGSEAFHKIAIEYFIKTGNYFAKDFNRLYYDIVQRELADPDKEMFFSICEQLMPTVEAKRTRQWLTDQKIFQTENLLGEKIFMDVNDYYTHNEWLGITKINLYTTFENGSDWQDGRKRYNMNGKSVKIELVHIPTGKIEYSKSHKIPNYPNGFGAIKIYFHHKTNSPGVAHFTKQDEQYNIQPIPIKVNSGLYGINITSANASRSYYRLMGECVFENRGKIMVANPFQCCDNTYVQLVHHNRAKKRTLVEPTEVNDQLCAFEVPFIKNKNCEPGILQIQVNAGGLQQNFQRNIGYGGAFGGHHFLIGAEPKVFLPPTPILQA